VTDHEPLEIPLFANPGLNQAALVLSKIVVAVSSDQSNNKAKGRHRWIQTK
jgi:bifunctional ADP-heptose synthase (sugar kinase/adenylyltransferase)